MKKILILLFVLSLNNYALGAGSDSSSDSSSETSLYDAAVKLVKRAGKLEKNGATYSVFEAKVSKDIILKGLDLDLIVQEKQVVSVEGVNGPTIKVGSMTEVNTSGNWPKLYDTAKKQ